MIQMAGLELINNVQIWFQCNKPFNGKSVSFCVLLCIPTGITDNVRFLDED